jgi:hypothetical protein
LTTIPIGDSVVIRGTVTDQCAGAKQLVDDGKFNSVPAISDEDMSAWMEYLYQQQVKPKDAKGVEVVLTTLDPNNNSYEIGRTTSDESGLYSIMWEPPVPGKYTIIATFEGSNSYYGSYAKTAMGVIEASSAAQAIEPEQPAVPSLASTQSEPAFTAATQPIEPEASEPTQASEAPLIAAETGIIATFTLAVVLGIVSFWALRKRK